MVHVPRSRVVKVISLALGGTVALLVTVVLGWRDRRQRHRWWARITYPIWLYVSVTGVLVYVFLYQL